MRTFSMDMERIAVGLNRPVLYIHGDGHTWERERLFDSGNVQLACRSIRAARRPPVRVQHTDDGEAPFVFDRRLPANRSSPYAVNASAKSKRTVPARGQAVLICASCSAKRTDPFDLAASAVAR